MNRSIAEAQQIMIDYATQISDVMGVSDGAARMVALLYMSPSAISIPIICERLSLTKGTVSLYLRLLEERRVILRARAPQGSRQKFYEINPHLWRDLARDMSRRHRRRLEITEEAVEKSLAALNESDKTAGAEDRMAERLIVERLEKFRMISTLSGRMVENFFSDSDRESTETGKETARRIRIE